MEQRHFDIVNHATPRLEYMDKALGRGKYTDDLELPNMAYAALVRCPYSHAKVLSIDVSEAEKVPGFLGCALPEEAARAAAEAVKVEYENLAPILDVKAALADNAPAMQPHLSDTNVVQRREVSQGDIAVGEEKSDIILEDHFVTPPMQHTMIELTCCICNFSDGEHMTIYSCSQAVFQERRILAELFGLREVDVHIIKPLVGAGFGARQQLHAQHAAALISRKIKRPARLAAGAVAPHPVVMTETAAKIDSDATDDEVIAQAEDELRKLAMPIKEVCMTPAVKRSLYRHVAMLLDLRK
jgi:CO/xanthine dehydrogenase Mo-binding subunit